MRFMQIESVLQTKNRSEPAKNRFSVVLLSELWLAIQLGNSSLPDNQCWNRGQ